MPERIFALFANVADQRERIQKMFLDAGMIDELVQPAPASLLYKVELRSWARPELLYVSVGGKGTERGFRRCALTRRIELQSHVIDPE
jgi:hypothetical protein